MPQVNLSLNKLYKELCPACKRIMINLIKDQLSDQAIIDTLEGTSKEPEVK